MDATIFYTSSSITAECIPSFSALGGFGRAKQIYQVLRPSEARM